MSVLMQRLNKIHSGGGDKQTFNTMFYGLVINGNNRSKEGSFNFSAKGQPEETFYENVVFLCPLEQAPLITYAKRNEEGSKEKFLSAYSFPSLYDSDCECPVNSFALSQKDIPKPKKYLKGMQSSLLIPTLVLGRQDKPLTHKMAKVQPIYWFEMDVTSYIAESVANFNRLSALNSAHPISDYIYQIHVKKHRAPDERNMFGFSVAKNKGEPVKLTPGIIQKYVTTDHPIVTDWLDQGTFCWDSDYFDMINCLAAVNYQRFVDPYTNEVADYQGEYERALEVFKDCASKYPPPKEKLQGGKQATQEADEVW